MVKLLRFLVFRGCRISKLSCVSKKKKQISCIVWEMRINKKYRVLFYLKYVSAQSCGFEFVRRYIKHNFIVVGVN